MKYWHERTARESPQPGCVKDLEQIVKELGLDPWTLDPGPSNGTAIRDQGLEVCIFLESPNFNLLLDSLQGDM
jgi:hypothetical protein